MYLGLEKRKHRKKRKHIKTRIRIKSGGNDHFEGFFFLIKRNILFWKEVLSELAPSISYLSLDIHLSEIVSNTSTRLYFEHEICG